MLKLTIYLAGHTEEKNYRNIAITNYGNKINFLNPMTITHLEVLDEIGYNEYETYIVRRDKKMILESDILVAYLDYNSPSWGTTMEIIYAAENDIPVYVIDSTPFMKNYNNPWVKFHTKKAFSNIETCFEYILN
jgi:nucleoside 2-deoxyribosyltransferase